MTADDKYSLVNRDDLTQPIQILLSQQQQTFSQFFSGFQISSLNFEYFRKIDDPHSGWISTDSEEAD